MMKRLFVIAVAFVLVGLAFCPSEHRSADAGEISPLTGENGYSGKGNEPTGGVFLPPAHIMSAMVPGGLYGTDGTNLYLIDKATGTTTRIGPHGSIENQIGALAFDDAGVLYGTSIGSNARLYTIDPATGTATAVGLLGIDRFFEGGLGFDASDQLFGVDQGTASNAKTIKIDKVTGAATILGPTPGENRDINGLAFDGQTFYAIDRVSNTFGSVNPTTGAYIPIGNPGAIIGDSGGLAIDPADGTIYATFSGTGGFYTINKATGSATRISASRADFGLAFAPSIDLTHIYLPLVLRHHVTPVSFPLHIGDPIPARPVAYQGEIFYAKSVLIPSSLPTGGHFYFSSSPSQVSPALVDDDLVVLLNGTRYFVYHFSPGGQVPQPAIVEVPRATMEQLAGKTANVEYRDVYAHIVEASSMWLIWTP